MNKIILTSLLLLTGCSSASVDYEETTYDMQETIDEMQLTIDELEDTIIDLEFDNEELLRENENLKDEIEELSEESSVGYTNEHLVESTKADDYYVEIEQNQPNQDTQAINPPGVFTAGSSQEHVKKIMGNPDNVTNNGINTFWWYGKQAWISFDKNGLVDSWFDYGNILKHE